LIGHRTDRTDLYETEVDSHQEKRKKNASHRSDGIKDPNECQAMKSPVTMLRSCKARISAIANRSEVASKGTVPLSTIREDRSADSRGGVEDKIMFEEVDILETESKVGGKKRRQLFQRLRQIAKPNRLAVVSEFDQDENTYTEDDTISDVDENHFVTSFDWVGTGMNESAVAITVVTEKNSIQKNQEKVVDNTVKKRVCFRAEDIWTACKVGDETFVESAIANDPALVHLAENGRTPLYNACLCGHSRIVKILLEAGAQDLDKTAYIAALNGPCLELLREHESNRKVQLSAQEEIAKRQVDDREKEETAAILKDLANTPLGAHGTISLGNDMYDCIAGEVAEAKHSNDTADTNNIDSGEEASMDVADDNDGSGTACDATRSSHRGNANVDAADESNTSTADVEVIEESFYSLYSVFIPFQSHLVRAKDEGFETILEPAINSGDHGSDMSTSDIVFDARVLNDAVEFIRVFTGQQDGTSGGSGGSSQASNRNMSSKLDHLNAKTSSQSKFAYDTDGTGSLSTDGQTFVSEGDSFLVEDFFDGELPFMEVMGEIEFTFCALLFPAENARHGAVIIS
jgi:hypothetical protein